MKLTNILPLLLVYLQYFEGSIIIILLIQKKTSFVSSYYSQDQQIEINQIFTSLYLLDRKQPIAEHKII
ncbi:hypothetical protein pb186bvf_003505 [Paramecium bursaria]